MSAITIITPENLSRFKSNADLAYAAKAAVDTLIGADTGKSARTIANEELAAQLIPANAQEALNTLTEIAAWIQEHPEDAAAINAAITALQAKVDTGDTAVSTYVSQYVTLALNTLGALATKSTVAESDLDAALKDKVNAAAEGNHAHANMDTLNGVTAEKIASWDAKANASDIPTFTEATDEQIDAMFA